MNQEKMRERVSKDRIIYFQNVLNSISTVTSLTDLNNELDAQLKIEDLILKSREASYSKLKAWAPIILSGSVIIISLVLAYAFWVRHTLEVRKVNLETRKVQAEIILNAAGSTQEETLANLTALTDAGLLYLDPEEIEKLKVLKPKK